MGVAAEPTQNSDELFKHITSALNGSPDALLRVLPHIHSADLAEALQPLAPGQLDTILDLLEEDIRGDVVTHIADIDEELVEEFVDQLSARELAEIVDDMDPDDAADLLEVTDRKKAEAALDEMPSEQADEVRELLRHASDTAGGIMTTEFFSVGPQTTRPQLIELLKIEQDDIETVQSIFVTTEDERLLGFMHAKDLLTAESDTPASAIMDRAVIQVVANTDQEACVNLMKRYDIQTLPVVDEANRLLGIITHDDILDVLEDEAEEDMYRLVGVGDNKPLEHGPMERAMKRLPWLTTTLVGMGLIGPLIMHRWFEATLDQVVILAFFIPAIMGLSGNTATQSATITVRGLATDEITFKDLFWMIRRELAVALIIAVVCALTMMLFAYGVSALGFSGETASFSLFRITITVGISMFAGILVAVLLGTAIPMLCHRAGVDPAVASGPFITTLIDISTQVIYLALATWLLLG